MTDASIAMDAKALVTPSQQGQPSGGIADFHWKDVKEDGFWSGETLKLKWDAWMYGLVGKECEASKIKKEEGAPAARAQAQGWTVASNDDGTATTNIVKHEPLVEGEIKRENCLLERKIDQLNKLFHEYSLPEKSYEPEWNKVQQDLKDRFIPNDENIVQHMYCEEVSIGGIAVDEHDCWLVVTDKRIVIFRNENCEHDTSGTTVEKQGLASVENKADEQAEQDLLTGKDCNVPTIDHYVVFRPRPYPVKNIHAHQLEDLAGGIHFKDRLDDMFGVMQCTKVRHSDIFFYSIPVGNIRGVNLDWKTATLTGHYRVDLNEGVKAAKLNSCQCHCFICKQDCCACCGCCSNCSCACLNCCKGPSCCKCPRTCWHVHPINCYRGCLVKCLRICCVPLRPFCDNPICRLVCCSRFMPKCWRKIDEGCIQTCCTNYTVGVLRRMDVFQVRELLGTYKFSDGEERFEFEGDENAGVLDTLKGTKHFIRIEYALLNNGPMHMLKCRASSYLGVDQAIPVVKVCNELQSKMFGAPSTLSMH